MRRVQKISDPKWNRRQSQSLMTVKGNPFRNWRSFSIDPYAYDKGACSLNTLNARLKFLTHMA